MRTLTYVEGSSLPDVASWIRENGAAVNLASGYTTTVVVGTGKLNGGAGFTKTDGITYQAGSGLPPDGTPNLVVEWDVTDLAVLTADRYLAEIRTVRDVDSRQYVDQFWLEIEPAVP